MVENLSNFDLFNLHVLVNEYGFKIDYEPEFRLVPCPVRGIRATLFDGSTPIVNPDWETLLSIASGIKVDKKDYERVRRFISRPYAPTTLKIPSPSPYAIGEEPLINPKPTKRREARIVDTFSNPRAVYKAYQENIKTLVTHYNFHPRWLKVDEYEFFQFTGHDANNFIDIGDPYLLDYAECKTDLAKDILERGMFTPFIFYTGENGQKIITMGKHRLFSLIKYHKLIKPIEQRFLFLELPYNQKDNESLLTNSTIFYGTPNLWFYNSSGEMYEKAQRNWGDIDFTLLITGDTLSRVIYGTDIKPFLAFNKKVEWELFMRERD